MLLEDAWKPHYHFTREVLGTPAVQTGPRLVRSLIGTLSGATLRPEPYVCAANARHHMVAMVQ